MAKITEVKSGTTSSFKITLPKELAKTFIAKNGKDISIKLTEKGFEILPSDHCQKCGYKYDGEPCHCWQNNNPDY